MYLGNSRAGGGVNGIGAREGFQGPELIERANDLFWIGQNGNRVRLEAGAGGLAGFEPAIEDDGWIWELLCRQSELCAKEDLSRPASDESHESHPFFEVAVSVPGASSWPRCSRSLLKNIRLSDELRGTKNELLWVAQEFGLEGLVAKKPNSVRPQS
jgi:hypothetical protein